MFQRPFWPFSQLKGKWEALLTLGKKTTLNVRTIRIFEKERSAEQSVVKCARKSAAFVDITEVPAVKS